jgi:hypothetical protein
MHACRYVNAKEYDWVGRKAKAAILQLTPFTWNEYHWQFFNSPARLAQVGGPAGPIG